MALGAWGEGTENPVRLSVFPQYQQGPGPQGLPSGGLLQEFSSKEKF